MGKELEAGSLWDSKGETNPADFPKPMENAAVKKIDEAAEKAARQAEEMKKMTEMALASFGDNIESSKEALKTSADALQEVQTVQENIKKTQVEGALPPKKK